MHARIHRISEFGRNPEPLEILLGLLVPNMCNGAFYKGVLLLREYGHYPSVYALDLIRVEVKDSNASQVSDPLEQIAHVDRRHFSGSLFLKGLRFQLITKMCRVLYATLDEMNISL
jgi:hypothetical protein